MIVCFLIFRQVLIGSKQQCWCFRSEVKSIESFPNCKIEAVVGGFHLVGLPVFNSIGGTKDDIKALGKVLSEYPVEKFYTGHCTGMKAYHLLKEVLGDRLEHLPTGRRVDI